MYELNLPHLLFPLCQIFFLFFLSLLYFLSFPFKLPYFFSFLSLAHCLSHFCCYSGDAWNRMQNSSIVCCFRFQMTPTWRVQSPWNHRLRSTSCWNFQRQWSCSDCGTAAAVSHRKTDVVGRSWCTKRTKKLTVESPNNWETKRDDKASRKGLMKTFHAKGSIAK